VCKKLERFNINSNIPAGICHCSPEAVILAVIDLIDTELGVSYLSTEMELSEIAESLT